MKKNEFIKNAIDENIADKKDILHNILYSCPKENGAPSYEFRHKRKAVKFAVSVAVIATIVFTGIFIYPPSNKTGQVSKNNSSSQISNMFTLVAYAVENPNSQTQQTDSKIKLDTKTVLNPNIKVQMPFGKIKRGKPTSFTDENGKVYDGYEVEMDDGLGFVCKGNNIESVTYTSSSGSLHYFDVDLMKKMEANGELYICKIPIPGSKISPKWGIEKIKKVFNEMWSSGELDEYKNKYFDGKNINLDDYSIGIDRTWTPTSESTYMTIANKQSGLPAYIKTGASVTANPDSTINWNPTKATDILAAEGPANYQDLPGDTITVTAKFTDGQTITQIVTLSFDKDGNIIAEVK